MKHFLPPPRPTSPPNAPSPGKSLSPLFSRQAPSFQPAPRSMFQRARCPVPMLWAEAVPITDASAAASFSFRAQASSPHRAAHLVHFPVSVCVMKISVPSGERSHFS